LKTREDKFKLIGGQPSLDFANTVGGRTKASGGKSQQSLQGTFVGEKLGEYTDLVAWAKKSGLLRKSEVRILLQKAEENPRAAQSVLVRAIKLREVIYRLVNAAIEGLQPATADLELLNEELKLARSHEKLVYEKNGFRVDWKDDDVSLDKMLWFLAESAAEILTSNRLDKVKQCVGENCGWVFLDTSRSGNRTWCSMSDCGNVAKVRRFRRKQPSRT
jgi:predicted RNA-binding Zn ribbon-like protein